MRKTISTNTRDQTVITKTDKFMFQISFNFNTGNDTSVKRHRGTLL